MHGPALLPATASFGSVAIGQTSTQTHTLTVAGTASSIHHGSCNHRDPVCRHQQYLQQARLRAFAEALLGAAHTSGSLAPLSTGVGPFQLQLRLPGRRRPNLRLGRHFVLRPVQADSLMTKLSNNAADRQNDLLISTGLN